MTALAAYRNLFRATRIAFQGDAPIIATARDQIRAGFRAKAGLDASDPAVQPAIQHAQEVATFLRANVVQGKREEGGVYRLRIHEETERGDNDTIKMADGSTIQRNGKPCADR